MFAETNNVLDGISGVITAVGAIIVGLTGLVTVLLQAYNIVQNRKQADSAQRERAQVKVDLAKQTEDVHKTTAEVKQKLETVVTQTNGITERAERSAAEAAEAKALLEVAIEKLKQVDPESAVLRKAETLIGKK